MTGPAMSGKSNLLILLLATQDWVEDGVMEPTRRLRLQPVIRFGISFGRFGLVW